MVKKGYTTKELKETKKNTKKLKKFSFPNQAMVIEAENYAEAVKKMQSLVSKNK